MNHEIVGGIVNNLPIEKMIAAPLVATIQAQSQMSHMLAQYVQDVGIDSDGNVRMVTMKYSENTVDTQGNPSSQDRYIQAPFLALTGIPNLAIEDVNISFDLEVSTAEEDVVKNNADSTVNTEYRSIWSPVTAKFSGTVSHSSEQTRRTDTRAKYSFNVNARKQGTPEGLMRIIDAVTNAVANPTSAEKRNNLVEATGTENNSSQSE